MDDITLVDKSSIVAQDVNIIVEAGAQLCLRLNANKCETISKNSTKHSESSAFEGFQKIEYDHICLLGASILQGPATNKCLREKRDELNKAMSRLSLLQTHDVMIILKNSLCIPKLMYILRTVGCDNALLTKFDNLVKEGVLTILNCDLSGDKYFRTFQPVKSGRLHCRSSSSLALSAFLASAAGTEELQAVILA